MWRAVWDGPSFVRLVVRRPDRSELVLEADGGQQPVFGRAHAIVSDGETVALCGAVDWSRPRFIPPIDRPAAIPRGGGSAILNVLASVAAEAGVEVMRYRGPYPTAALFDSLLHCFTVDDPSSALGRFTADVEERAVRGTMEEVAVDFRPAPCVWSWPGDGVCVETRGGIRRVFVEGCAFGRGTAGHRRLVGVTATSTSTSAATFTSTSTSTSTAADLNLNLNLNLDLNLDLDLDSDPHPNRTPPDLTATIVIAGAPWRAVARIAADGTILDGPHAPPPLHSALIGTTVPREVVEVLAEVLASRAPRLLAAALRRVVLERALVWADTGDELARATDDELRLHAVLGERLADQSAGRVLALLVDAIEPVARRLAQSSLAKLV